MLFLMRSLLQFNDTRLGDSAVESVFNDLFVTCRDFYGEEGRPPEDEKSAPEGVKAVDPPPELGGEWLTVAERRDKDSRGESWRSQLLIYFSQLGRSQPCLVLLLLAT